VIIITNLEPPKIREIRGIFVTLGTASFQSIAENMVHETIYICAGCAVCFYTGLNAADVKLAWDPNTQPELAGYKLSYGATSGQYGTTVDVGNVTTYTVSGLTSGTYYFAVRALWQRGTDKRVFE